MPTSEREVLTSLPDTRPTRRSTKRPARGTAAPGPDQTAEPTKPKAVKAKPTAKRKSAPKAKAATPAAAKPKSRSKVGVPKGQSSPKAPAREEVPPGTIPAAGWASSEPAKAPTSGGFNTDDLLGTALTAVAQIAQIGLSSVNQSARSLLDKLPRP